MPQAQLTETSLEQEKKEPLLEAAKQLFSRFGYKKTTVDEIAEASGVSKRTVYELFDSKEKILAELVMREALSFRKYLTGEIKLLGDPVAKFRLFCEMSTHYFDQNPFLGQVLFDEAELYQPFLGDEIHIVEEGMRDIVAGLLREGIRKGIYREMSVPAMTECIFVLFRGFTYHRTSERDGNKEWVPFILRSLSPASKEPDSKSQ
jgi:AcrR family transcriptional regulator